jgi:hypothetical protein
MASRSFRRKEFLSDWYVRLSQDVRDLQQEESEQLLLKQPQLFRKAGLHPRMRYSFTLTFERP